MLSCRQPAWYSFPYLFCWTCCNLVIITVAAYCRKIYIMSPIALIWPCNRPGLWLSTLTGDCIGMRDLVAYYIGKSWRTNQCSGSRAVFGSVGSVSFGPRRVASSWSGRVQFRVVGVEPSGPIFLWAGHRSCRIRILSFSTRQPNYIRSFQLLWNQCTLQENICMYTIIVSTLNKSCLILQSL